MEFIIYTFNKFLLRTIVTGRGPSAEWICLWPAGPMWVLDFMLQRAHSMSPGDFKSMFIKAGVSEIKKGLG